MARNEEVSIAAEAKAEAPAPEELRARVLKSLSEQGFEVAGETLVLPSGGEKDAIRSLQTMAVRRRVEQSRPGLKRHEDRLLEKMANGSEVDPSRIVPRLVEVTPDSDDELLFRYARLHWSIPTSAGYGRRVRFLVIDDSNDKLIGLFGLGDPVYSLGPRDRWIGWNVDQKKQRIRSVMDAFVLGAVPPYSHLLCGKLVALLAASDEVRAAVQHKYGGKPSLISGKNHDGQLALITTTSALGRSSIYNRLRYEERHVFISAGYTSGSGEFQFSDGIYHDLRAFALANCEPTAKNARWGSGFRSRREIVLKALPELNLPRNLIYHGIGREIFLVPMASNTSAFLRGETESPEYLSQPAADLWGHFRERWLLPRAQRDKRWLQFDPESYRLWPKK